jgi:outer membrane lipoprotein SlyB
MMNKILLSSALTASVILTGCGSDSTAGDSYRQSFGE